MNTKFAAAAGLSVLAWIFVVATLAGDTSIGSGKSAGVSLGRARGAQTLSQCPSAKPTCSSLSLTDCMKCMAEGCMAEMKNFMPTGRCAASGLSMKIPPPPPSSGKSPSSGGLAGMIAGAMGAMTGGLDVGLGPFTMHMGGASADTIDWADAACADMSGVIHAIRAFGVLAAILLPVLAVAHVLQALGKAVLPGGVAFGHVAAAFMLLLVWALSAAAYNAEWCGGAMSATEGAAPGYGIFLCVLAMLFQVVAFVLAKKGAAERTPPNLGADADAARYSPMAAPQQA